jgi:hypothetical protein
MLDFGVSVFRNHKLGVFCQNNNEKLHLANY